MSVPESEKATRYVGALNTARLGGDWTAVPELVRKLEKHAPNRKCLILGAATEAQIAAATKGRPTTSSSSTANLGGLTDVSSKLQQAISQDRANPQEAFQAEVSLQHVLFLRKEWPSLLEQGNEDVKQQLMTLGAQPSAINGWTWVCLVKSRYFRGVAQEESALKVQAKETYRSALQMVEDIPGNAMNSVELRYWTERLSGRACTLAAPAERMSTINEANSALLMFRSWSKYGQTQTTKTVATPASDGAPRRRLWGLYYRLLSQILASGLVYTDSPDAPLASQQGQPSVGARARQRKELKEVETSYETAMLQETRFPTAEQSNEEVELWCSQVIDNWRILCGSRWQDGDLGGGGKESVGRGVLDILYRAASKTFHSTPILRHLFTVHASLAEFDLSIKAFDTYAEIIGKGKSRTEKTGNHEIGLDTDDLVLFTSADAIQVLCLYGSRKEAEKAFEVGKTVSRWLQRQRPSSSASNMSNGEKAADAEQTSTEANVSPTALAAAYRAIGQSEANWARYTYEPAQRTGLLARAQGSLRHSVNLLPQFEADPATIGLLALTLAEGQETASAIQILKAALMDAAEGEHTTSAAFVEFDRRRKLIPLWHLLALLLTVRGEYESALGMCEAAIDQLVEAAQHVANPGTTTDGGPARLVSEALQHLEEHEKESLIEIKITEMELLALTEGVSSAVDRSQDLLSLYARFFGDPNVGKTRLQASHAPIPRTQPNDRPTSSWGGSTRRSIRGSILGRPKSMRKNLDKNTFEPPIDEKTQTVNEPIHDGMGAPITISITNEDHDSPANTHKHHIPHHPFKLRHGETHGLQGQGGAPEKANLEPSGDDKVLKRLSQHGFMGPDAAKESGNTQERPDQPLRSIPNNMPRDNAPLQLSPTNQAPGQDIRLPAPFPSTAQTPVPRFPSAHQRRHRISLLVEIWLFVAALYARNEFLEDAKGAIDEAQNLVAAFQEEVSAEESTSRAFDEKDFGSGKSVGRLWADVWAQRGSFEVSHDAPHEAITAYEQALTHYPDHPAGIVGLSKLLLDIFEQKIPAEPGKSISIAPIDHSSVTQPVPTATSTSALKTIQLQEPDAPSSSGNKRQARNRDPPPSDLHRLAARDRAYMLLSTLTKLGEGWDEAEAWFTLARAHEVGGQLERARECLWWVVQLEDTSPIRPWRCIRGNLVQ